MNLTQAEDILRRVKHYCDAERSITHLGCHVSSATLLDDRIKDVGEMIVLSCSVDLFKEPKRG